MKQLLDGLPKPDWDRHTTVNTQAMSLWFLTDDQQDNDMKSKFLPLFKEIEKITDGKEVVH